MQFLKGKKILVISPETWEAHQVSKHHYANKLVELGNRVYFLNPEVGLSIDQIDTDLFSVHFKGHFPGLRRLPGSVREYLTLKDFRKLEEMIDCKIDIIWNFDTSRFFELSRIDKKITKICHIVDLNQDFERSSLAKTSDICFGTSDFILKELQIHNSRSYKVNHGLNDQIIRTKEKLPGQNTIKAVYAGNLDIKYLDFDLIIQLMKAHQKVDFIMIGHYSESNPFSLSKMSNMYLIGKRPANELIGLYEQADICLVAYLADQFEEQLANPHKILEYLASGNVVIATKTSEYKESEHVETANSKDDFLTLFMEIVNNLADYNSAQRSEARINFAMQNRYRNQLDKIDKLLSAL